MQMMLLWGKHFSAKSITIIKIRIQRIEAIGDRRARNSEDARHGPVYLSRQLPPLQAKAGGRRATSGADAIKVINFYFSKSIKGVQGPA